MRARVVLSWLWSWKRVSVAAALVALLLVEGPAGAFGQSGRSGPGLVNGGFEEERDGQPSGWPMEDRLVGKGRLSLETRLKQTGRFALKLAPNARNTPGPQPFAVGQALPAANFRGKRLRASAWLAAEGGATAVVGLAAIGKGGASPEMVQLVHGSDRPEPSVEHASLDVPAGADLIIVFCAVNGTRGAAFFDDVVVELDAGTPADRAEPSAEAGWLGAEIVVDAGRDVRRIPRSLYGTNVEWVPEFNAIWNKADDAPDAEIVRLTRELGVSLIRFPGGGFSDAYHWRDGIGPRASRVETPHFPGGPRSRHSFGTEEALEFARRVGARLLITVNAGSGTPEEAAEWVRYVNGRGNDPQRRVEYWEVGNELYMKDDASKGSLPPDQYARKFLAFARAMREADPRIKIGAIGGENFGRYSFVGYPDWNKVVLSKAGSAMDFLAVHNAYAPVLIGVSKPDPRAVYVAMLAAPRLIAANLDKVAGQVEAYAPARAKSIPLAVTEWGPLFHADLGHPFVDHVKTLGSALFTASVMKAFLESPRTEIANFFKLSEYTFMGWLGPRRGRFAAKAPYFALQMFTRHFGEVLLSTTTKSPTFDSPGLGVVDSVRDVPYLEAVASRSADGKLVYLLVINKHMERPLRASIRLTGLVPQPRGTAWVLAGSGLDANTGTEIDFPLPGLKVAAQTPVPPWNRFGKGAPGEVTLTSRTVDNLGRQFTYSFPPLSVTSIEIRGR